MSANNHTSARAPLQFVSESVAVLFALLLGLIQRDGSGTYFATDRGVALGQALEKFKKDNPDVTDEGLVQFIRSWISHNP